MIIFVHFYFPFSVHCYIIIYRLITYNIGLLSLISTLVVRGILEVLNKDFIGLPHIAGTAHAILGISLIWFMIILKKSIFTK